MTKKGKRRQSPHFGGKDIENTASESTSSCYCTTSTPNSQARFEQFFADVDHLTDAPYTPLVALALSDALTDLVDDAIASGDLRTLRAVRDTALPNPIPFQPFHGQGTDKAEFFRVLNARRARAKLEIALGAPGLAADAALLTIVGAL